MGTIKPFHALLFSLNWIWLCLAVKYVLFKNSEKKTFFKQKNHEFRFHIHFRTEQWMCIQSKMVNLCGRLIQLIAPVRQSSSHSSRYRIKVSKQNRSETMFNVIYWCKLLESMQHCCCLCLFKGHIAFSALDSSSHSVHVYSINGTHLGSKYVSGRVTGLSTVNDYLVVADDAGDITMSRLYG